MVIWFGGKKAIQAFSDKIDSEQKDNCIWAILATASTVFLRRGRTFPRKVTKTIEKQAFGPHTNTLDREIKSPIQMTDFELMTYT